MIITPRRQVTRLSKYFNLLGEKILWSQTFSCLRWYYKDPETLHTAKALRILVLFLAYFSTERDMGDMIRVYVGFGFSLNFFLQIF